MNTPVFMWIFRSDDLGLWLKYAAIDRVKKTLRIFTPALNRYRRSKLLSAWTQFQTFNFKKTYLTYRGSKCGAYLCESAIEISSISSLVPKRLTILFFGELSPYISRNRYYSFIKYAPPWRKVRHARYKNELRACAKFRMTHSQFHEISDPSIRITIVINNESPSISVIIIESDARLDDEG